MDKQLEERIRQRAYELWVQHGCLPDRSDEYWYQAEQEIRGRSDLPSAADMRQDTHQDTHQDTRRDAAPTEIAPTETGFGAAGEEPTSVGFEEAAPSESGSLFPTETSGVPAEEGAPAPVARKTRRKRTEAAMPSQEESEPAGAPAKRRRSARTS